MSEEQVQEIHKQFLKGVTLKILVISVIFLLPIIYQSSIFIHNQGLQGEYLKKMNAQLDTVQQRQSRYEFGSAIKFQILNDKVDAIKEKQK